MNDAHWTGRYQKDIKKDRPGQVQKVKKQALLNATRIVSTVCNLKHCFSWISSCVRRLSDHFQLPTLWCGSPQINESHSGIYNFILNKRRIYIFIECHHHIQVTFPFISVV